MRVERLECIPYALPFRQPYVTARGRLDRREIVLVRLHGANGMVGLGEAVPLSLRGGAPLAQVLSDLRRCQNVLRGAEGPDALERCRSTGVSTPALAAIDMALLDLAGKTDGRPVWEILGAAQARPIQCNATLVAGTTESVIEDALGWQADGFNVFKLKVGYGPASDQVAPLREALASEAKLRIDANGTWQVPEALAQLDALEIELAEQPVATLEELAQVRRDVSMPIVGDESINDVGDAEKALSLQACDATTVKLSKVGGSKAAREIAALLPSYLSSALDGPVGIAAAAHVAQAIPDAGLAHGLATQRLYSEWPALSGAVLEGPWLRPVDAPGLGVEIDEQALSRLRIDVE